MAILETLVLDGLNISDDTNYRLEQLDMPPPQKTWEWVKGADSDGAILSRPPLHDSREITARVRVVGLATMDLALAKLGALNDKLQEAERNEAGITLTWTPANSTKTLTAYVLGGEVTGLPIAVQGDDVGWFLALPGPVVTVKLTCKPFLYGAEVVGTPASSTLPLVTVELTGVTGDVPAEGRLIVTDNATQPRRLVRWGIESRHYPTSSPPSLIVESDNLVTTGYSGAQTTRAGAYDVGGGNTVVRATLAARTQLTAVCGLGNLGHVGTFHVFGRVWAAAASTGTVYVRLAWSEGDGPTRANAYVAPAVVNAFADVDLGLVTIPEKVLGTQRWTGRVEAYSTITGETLDVDMLQLIPAGEGYGEARATYAYEPGVLVARDEFTGMAATTVLNARVAPSGGTWATSGVATDFAAADAPVGSETMARSTTPSEASPRFAVLGSTNYTNIEAGVAHRLDAAQGSDSDLIGGVLARWTNSTNYLVMQDRGSDSDTGTSDRAIEVVTVIAGAPTTLVYEEYSCEADAWRFLRTVVFASGRGIAQVIDVSNNVIASVSFASSTLATGGTLATGKFGFYDHNGSVRTVTRYYDAFYAATPPPEPLALQSAQSIEFRSESTTREDATGVYWGPPPSYRGSRFVVPPAGTRSRKARVAVIARRNDVLTSPDDQIADSLTVQVNYTPRYVLAPR